MAVFDSPAAALKRARTLLRPPQGRDNPLAAVAAAAFFAFSGLSLAVAMIILPPPAPPAHHR